MQVRFVAWCHRRNPGGVDDPVAYYNRQRKSQRLQRALQARAWRPRGYAAVRDLAEMRTVQCLNNQRCTCDDDVPSILCRVHVCWAFELGMCDGVMSSGSGRYPSSRVHCNCMEDAYSMDDDPQHTTAADSYQIAILDRR